MRLPIIRKKSQAFTEYKHVRTLRLMNIIIMGFLAFVAVQSIIFIYNNIYQSIDRVEGIMLLQAELGTLVVDFDRFERVKDAWNKKYTALPHELAWDPFRGVPIEETTTTSTPQNRL